MAELLAPAGNIEALDAAIGEGADAVYLGLKSFNARLRSANFAWNQFEAAVQSLHRMGKKIFVTVNTVIEERETERLYRFLAYLDAVGPDGLIVQDFGVVRMVQEFFPRLRLHASTQMNTASLRAVNLLGKQGIKRVVLARELGLEEIKRIRANTTAELEVFVHGALCVSESGLCLFSSYLGGKSANRGMCTQACRRFYTADEESGVEPGYYFSPCDLQLIDKIPELVTAGVDSFKIEGRMKSAEYVGAVTAAYRYMLDNWQHDRKAALAAAKRILSTDFARSKTTFWYGFDSPDDAQRGTVEGSEQIAERILNPAQAGGTGIYLGKIERTRSAKNGLVFALLSGIGLWRAGRTEKGKRFLQRGLLRFPLFSGIYAPLLLGNMSRTLGMLLKNGVSLLKSLVIVKSISDNVILRTSIENMIDGVQAGHELSGFMDNELIYPHIARQMVTAGEKSGRLEDMLLWIADDCDSRVSARLHMLTALLEPIMILVLGSIVGFVVIAIILPIFEMSTLAG